METTLISNRQTRAAWVFLSVVGGSLAWEGLSRLIGRHYEYSSTISLAGRLGLSAGAGGLTAFFFDAHRGSSGTPISSDEGIEAILLNEEPEDSKAVRCWLDKKGYVEIDRDPTPTQFKVLCEKCLGKGLKLGARFLERHSVDIPEACTVIPLWPEIFWNSKEEVIANLYEQVIDREAREVLDLTSFLPSAHLSAIVKEILSDPNEIRGVNIVPEQLSSVNGILVGLPRLEWVKIEGAKECDLETIRGHLKDTKVQVGLLAGLIYQLGGLEKVAGLLEIAAKRLGCFYLEVNEVGIPDAVAEEIAFLIRSQSEMGKLDFSGMSRPWEEEYFQFVAAQLEDPSAVEHIILSQDNNGLTFDLGTSFPNVKLVYLNNSLSSNKI